MENRYGLLESINNKPLRAVVRGALLSAICVVGGCYTTGYGYQSEYSATPRQSVEEGSMEERTNHLRDVPSGMCRSFRGRIGACDQNGFNWFDRDFDGIHHSIDNCPYTYNPGQEDRNNNGVGDACEQDPMQWAWQLHGSGSRDTDGDGIPDDIDPCPLTFSYYNSPDRDSDGVPDICDTDANGDGVRD